MQTDKSNTENELMVITKPQICGIDLTKEVETVISETKYNLYSGTLGAICDVPNKGRGDSQLFRLDFDFPENFHEYDILIIDLTNEKRKDFKQLLPGEIKSKSRSVFYLSCP